MGNATDRERGFQSKVPLVARPDVHMVLIYLGSVQATAKYRPGSNCVIHAPGLAPLKVSLQHAVPEVT